jgi:glycosyltransferase involved in cell wall biosynthesis
MTGDRPKVSVCIPVFNGANYIAESIESVLAQTFADFELIVCDNCSTDATGDITRSFRDSRLTYVRNKRNLGAAGNANRCLQLARGEYIGLWHHDDVMLSDNLARKVRVLDDYPSVGFVHSNVTLIDATGHPLNVPWTAECRRDYVEPGLSVFRRYAAHLPFGGMIFIGSVLTRQICYERLGGFHTELPNCHDNEMWMRIALYYDVACLGAPLVKWRQHAASGSNTTPGLKGARFLRQHHQVIRILFRKHRDRIPDHRALYQHENRAFCEKALSEGAVAFHRHEFTLARAHLCTAARVYPRILGRGAFWALALRVAGGPGGGRFYRTLRRALKRLP